MMTVRVHVLEVGWLQFPKGWFRSRTWAHAFLAVLRGRRSGGPPDAIPILSYVIEHDEGHIEIDTGTSHELAARINGSRRSSFLADVHVEPDQEVDARMRAIGLRPEDVRLVLPTHLHYDHAGGIEHFPDAETLIHRREWEGREGLIGYEWRCQSETWPTTTEPRLYDLEPEPYGPFDTSLPLTDDGDLVALPTPGHTDGHVAFAVRTPDLTLLFSGDHLIRQSWYAADLARGMHPVNFNARLTEETNARLERFIAEFPTLLLPSHDVEAEANLARWEPLRIIQGAPGYRD